MTRTRHELVQSHQVRHHRHRGGRLGHFNAAVGRLVSRVMSSMYFFWFCVGLDLISLPAVFQGQITVGNYLSSVVIQLLALPVLAYMGDLQQRASDARAEADHRTLLLLERLNQTQLEILEQLRDKETAP